MRGRAATSCSRRRVQPRCQTIAIPTAKSSTPGVTQLSPVSDMGENVCPSPVRMGCTHGREAVAKPSMIVYAVGAMTAPLQIGRGGRCLPTRPHPRSPPLRLEFELDAQFLHSCWDLLALDVDLAGRNPQCNQEIPNGPGPRQPHGAPRVGDVHDR
jgi:hypothetical protein